jgi:hypothetical protein
MITINPPQVVPFAPASMAVASVKINAWIEPNLGIANLNVQLFTAAGVPIPTDRTQIPVFDRTAQTAFLAYVAGTTDGLAVAIQKAAFAYLKSAYGLTGTVS